MLFPEMNSNRILNGWSYDFQFEILNFIDMLQTSFFKIFLTPYYSSRLDETILLYESLQMQIIIKKTLKNEIWGSRTQKNQFFEKIQIFIFFGSDVQPSSGISTSIKSIGIEILSASIYSMSNYFRKWTQIEIWTDGPMTFFNCGSLNLSICRRPHFSRFPWHRITLRVWMWTSCSTSHWV